MKKLFLWSCLLLTTLPWAAAQGDYFWAGDGPLRLVEDKASLCLHFEEAVHPDKALDLENPLVARLHDPERGARRMVVIELTSPATTSADRLAARLLRDGNARLRSAAFGVLADGAIPMWRSHRILYRPGAVFDMNRFQDILGHYPGTVVTQTPTGIPALEVAAIEDAVPLANALYESGLMAWCQPELASVSRAMSPQGPPPLPMAPCPPSDEFFAANYLFYLDNQGQNISNLLYPYVNRIADIDIDAPEAWCISTGNSNIVVAVIDEGVEAHEDLENDATGQSRVLPGYTTSDPLNGTGAPLVTTDNHGMAVAGVIAASHNTIGTSGIAPGVKILPVHVFTDGVALPGEYADALRWAYKNGADILNNSWGYDNCAAPGLYQVIEDAIDSALVYGRGGLGSLVVFSAGEVSQIPKCVAYPATLPQVFTAGIVTPQGQKPFYSGSGPQLDVVGVSTPDNLPSIAVIDRMGELGVNNSSVTIEQFANINYTKWFGGTSVAAATTSGIAALILSVNAGLTYTQVANLLTSTADDMGASGFDNTFGHGRLNAQAALAATPPPAPSLPVAWLGFEGEAVATGIQLSWSTARELHNDRFVVEAWRGGAFVALGEVPGAGDSDQPQAYGYLDQTAQTGLNRYRLRQVDLDGQTAFSPEVEVWWTETSVSTPYPVPADAQVLIPVRGLAGNSLWITVSDLQGRVVAEVANLPVTADREEIALDVSSLPSGLYGLRLRSASRVFSPLKLQIVH